jgi:toxin ParE1/3/4
MIEKFKISITVQAERDLESIYDYVADHGSPDIADALLDRLVDRIGSLAEFSHRGGIVPETAIVKRRFRQILLSPYRCIYSVTDHMITVVAVLDGRRNVEAVLTQRLLQQPD